MTDTEKLASNFRGEHKPTYEHDCTHCKFLGSDHDGNDWYFCKSPSKPETMSSIIMRQSSEGHDYCSSPVECLWREGKWDPVKLKHPRVPPTDPMSWGFTAFYVWQHYIIKSGESPETGEEK